MRYEDPEIKRALWSAGRGSTRRHNVAGHRPFCDAYPTLGIRRIDGTFRIARACACLALVQYAPAEFASYAEAEAALPPGWWRE